MDEPFGDASVLPTYLLSKITRRGVTVALSGDGGDEVFGGYDTYKGYQTARFIPQFFVKLSRCLIDLLPVSDKKVTLGFKIKRFARDFESDINKRHLNWMATFNDASRVKLLGERFVSNDSLIDCGNEKSLLSVQLNDIHNYLPEDILKKVDYASMLNSLEARVPFLDYELVPMVLSLPAKYKIKGLRTKSLLKKIASKYIPAKIINRPKRGFTVPVSKWIKTSRFIQQALNDRRYFGHKMLNYDYVQDLFETHISGKADNARQLWLIFVFNYWYSTNITEIR
jgi:asparagine synthase (glutamine-hydrolysing)